MKKIGIITIIDNNNYGNRLQNYAVQKILIDYGYSPKTLINIPTNNRDSKGIKFYIKKFLIKFIVLKRWLKISIKRKRCFKKFNKNIVYAKKSIDVRNAKKFLDYDYFVVGSDQVWNPKIGRLRDIDMLNFAPKEKRVAFSASIAISEIPLELEGYAKKNFLDFKSISVREENSQKIIENLTSRKDIVTLVDPTMLLSSREWDKVSCKPEKLQNNKYILLYFLGNITEDYSNEINKISVDNNYEIINILDKNSWAYNTGPSEFLYLIKNASLVCTDSFHACVFSIIYKTPFLIFDRKQDGIVSMNSRIDTLLDKFSLEDRKFNGEITNELLECDFNIAHKKLEKEKQKSYEYLKQSLK